MQKYNDVSFIFDIDGTICPIKGENELYEDLVPYKEMVDKIRYYKKNGAKIALFTARNMRTHEGKIGRINKHTAPILINWLKKWNIPYDEVIYGKPWPGKKGFYIDDRTIRPNEFIYNSLDEMKGICDTSRLTELMPNPNNLEIVITMGGKGSRFRDAGYDVPKYMIEAKGKSMFEWSLQSLEDYKNIVSQFIFIAMKDESVDVEKFIHEKCSKLGLANYKIIVLDYLTDGQATTTMLASKYWNSGNSLFVYNIDTYVEQGGLSSQELHGDGFIPCFEGIGNHWSFVKTSESGEVIEIKEKERISNNCTVGAYYFKTCQLFTELYFEFYSNPDNVVKGEKYIAPLYDFLLKKGGKIYISNIPTEKVHVLGTPVELDDFLKIDLQ